MTKADRKYLRRERHFANRKNRRLRLIDFALARLNGHAASLRRGFYLYVGKDLSSIKFLESAESGREKVWLKTVINRLERKSHDSRPLC